MLINEGEFVMLAQAFARLWNLKHIENHLRFLSNDSRYGRGCVFSVAGSADCRSAEKEEGLNLSAQENTGTEEQMELKKLEYDLTVCKVEALADIDMKADFFFLGKTEEELSLVCRTEDVPAQTIARDDGWKGFRIAGVLDFSLIGILSKLSSILADNGIGIFAVSTFNTDYILVKAENFEKALTVLSEKGYTVH